MAAAVAASLEPPKHCLSALKASVRGFLLISLLEERRCQIFEAAGKFRHGETGMVIKTGQDFWPLVLCERRAELDKRSAGPALISKTEA